MGGERTTNIRFGTDNEVTGGEVVKSPEVFGQCVWGDSAWTGAGKGIYSSCTRSMRM